MAGRSVALQKSYLISKKIKIIQGDMATINVKVDFLYLIGVIQHTISIEETLKNALNCLNPGGGVSGFILFVDTSDNNIRAC